MVYNRRHHKNALLTMVNKASLGRGINLVQRGFCARVMPPKSGLED